MRECFHGWRRKAGCVTLVMACVFMVGWARSTTTFDTLTFIDSRHLNGFGSERGTVQWVRNWTTDGSERDFPHGIHWSSFPIRLRPVDFVDKFPQIDEWRIRCCGFDFYKCQYGGINQSAAVWIFPYWSIVLPLTALSTWLLWPRREQNSCSKTPVETA